MSLRIIGQLACVVDSFVEFMADGPINVSILYFVDAFLGVHWLEDALDEVADHILGFE